MLLPVVLLLDHIRCIYILYEVFCYEVNYFLFCTKLRTDGLDYYILLYIRTKYFVYRMIFIFDGRINCLSLFVVGSKEEQPIFLHTLL